MDSTEPETSENSNPLIESETPYITVQLLECDNDAVVRQSIMTKTAGAISAISVDSSEKLNEKRSAFNTYAQVINGTANIVIDGISSTLRSGQGIVIPAHIPNQIKPKGKSKILLTVIKSGYE